MSELTTVPKKPKRLNPKQKKTINNWTDENSKSFGNLFESAVSAGFRPSYALKLSSNRPSWLSETVRANFEPAQIKQALQNLAMSASNSRSPDDTRLKALEILAKVTGMIDNNKGSTTVNIVQPILNGESVKKVVSNTVIDSDTAVSQ